MRLLPPPVPPDANASMLAGGVFPRLVVLDVSPREAVGHDFHVDEPLTEIDASRCLPAGRSVPQNNPARTQSRISPGNATRVWRHRQDYARIQCVAARETSPECRLRRPTTS